MNITTCEACGKRQASYTHKLNQGLVASLKKLSEVYIDKPVKLKDLGLTFNQHANFQKLQYWGLVERETRGYHLTATGRLFLSGDVTIRDRVTIRNKQVLIVDDGAQHVHIDSYFPVQYQQREEYIAKTLF